ncbi:hypothetical protein MATL_G00258830 [Megalops atlanticus]|uniref:FAM194 C-terminal domain-containing protein n=1 Tax=Megalops atlanticus TaxID=7932 RepID=A0A9D3P8N8_MEGAT|nr:hypothetical protein MATL_G00258830 [Megalops atlanticus]
MGDTLRSGPIYFFDQPSGRRCHRSRKLDYRSPCLNIFAINPFLESANKSSTGKKSVLEAESARNGDALPEERMGKSERREKRETFLDDQGAENDGEKYAEAPPGAPQDELSEEISLLEEYKQAAPPLLLELGQVLQECQGCEEGFFPRGLGNVLNYTWKELTEGAAYFKRQGHKGTKQRKAKGSVTSDKRSVDTPEEKTSHSKKKLRKKSSVEEKGVEKIAQESSNLRIKPNATNGQKLPVSHLSTTINFSISSRNCQEQGWIVQQEEGPLSDPQWESLCRWIVERLGQAQMTIKEQNAKLAEQGLAYPLLSPKVEEPPLQKLHYRTNDGTSFVYYPSGHIAVCHSRSGLPCGGFYTNVFGNAPDAPVLATFTAFGHGTVTHPLSGTVTAAWDQQGGVLCDLDGTVTREWAWQGETRPNKPIVIEVTELICVRVWSPTSMTLLFRSHQESVQLALSPLRDMSPPQDLGFLETDENFTSSAAWELSRANGQKVLEAESSGKFTANKPVAVKSSCEALEMVHEVECEQEVRGFRRGGRADQDLRRLQRAVRRIVNDWLEHYRTATGFGGPDIHRAKDSSPRRCCEAADTCPHQLAAARGTRPGAAGCHGGRAGRSLSMLLRWGQFGVHSNIRLEPVLILRSPEIRRPAAVPSSPCPVLLRGALDGDEGHRQCRCSARRMPLVTDLEYDAFVGGQASCSASEQVLVVCVTASPRPHTQPAEDFLEELYGRMNKNRTAPCTQCYLDSFRLVRYEVPPADSTAGTHNTLLQRRNNVAPGMFLMYVGGKLLFADYIFNGYSCSVRDLQKQIAKTRDIYRLGQSLPPDFRFSPQVGIPAVVGVSPAPHDLWDKTVAGGLGIACHSPQAPHPSEKRSSQISDRAPPAQDSATSRTLRRTHLLLSKRVTPATLPFLPNERSPQRAGP